MVVKRYEVVYEANALLKFYIDADNPEEARQIADEKMNCFEFDTFEVLETVHSKTEEIYSLNSE